MGVSVYLIVNKILAIIQSVKGRKDVKASPVSRDAIYTGRSNPRPIL